MNKMYVLLALTTLLTPGCRQAKNLDEMHAKTVEMADTTKQMNTKTGEMGTTMKGMNTNMDTMNTTMVGMDNKMGQMNGTMGGMNKNMNKMNGTMVGMDSKMGTMNKSTGKMADNMDKMVDDIGETVVLMKGMNGHLVDTKKDMGKMVKHIETVAEKTGDMGADMKILVSEIKDTKGTMGEMNNNMKDLHDNANQSSKTMRKDLLIAMNEAVTIENKMSHASAYFYAFEFQLQKNFGDQVEEKKQELMKNGVAEFFAEMTQFVKTNYSIDTVTADNDMKNLWALSARIHELNTNQRLMCEREKTECRTMLSLIEDGLKARQAQRKGELKELELKDYQKQVIFNSDAAEYILQVRHNIMAFIPMFKLGKMDKLGLAAEARSFVSLASSFLAGWEPKVDSFDDAALEQYLGFLKMAEETRDFLTSVEVPLRFNLTYKMIRYRMSVPAEKAAGDSIKSQVIARLQKVKG